MLSIAISSIGSESEVLHSQACTNRELDSPGRGYSSDKNGRKELALMQNPVFTLEAGLLRDVVAQQPSKERRTKSSGD